MDPAVTARECKVAFVVGGGWGRGKGGQWAGGWGGCWSGRIWWQWHALDSISLTAFPPFFSWTCTNYRTDAAPRRPIAYIGDLQRGKEK